jgi:putative transposase
MGVSRSSSYYKSVGAKTNPLIIDEWKEVRMAIIDEVHVDLPASGARKMAKECTRRGYKTTRYQAGQLMAEMGIAAMYPKPKINTSKAAAHHKKFPYLLSNPSFIKASNQVWAIDITYIQLGRRHMYLSALIDWYSRQIVGWELSDTLETDAPVKCVEDAIAKYGKPNILNSDQGSVFTAELYVNTLAKHGIRQSMDGKARWVDNRIIERWFRTLKTECLRVNEYSTVRELKHLINDFVTAYNERRLHESLGYITPKECYMANLPKAA